jgi:hypothetical protein
MDIYTCKRCGREFTADSYNSISDNVGSIDHPNYDCLCDACYRRFVKCAICGDSVFGENVYSAYNNNNDTVYICYEDKYKLWKCLECGNYYLPDVESNEAIRGTAIGLVCTRCKNNYYNVCGFCNKIFRRGNRIYINGDSKDDICVLCANTHYKTCGYCGNYFTSDHLNPINENTSMRFCDDCILRYSHVCDSCGKHTFDDYETGNGDYLCKTCAQYSGKYTFCDECDRYFLISVHHFHYQIHSASYKPNPIFHGKEKNGLYVGIEIEAENEGDYNNDDIAKELLESFSDNENNFYIKNDGSLNHGLEVVSHPYTITKILKCTWLSDVLNMLDSHGFKSHNTSTCGLHVHLSRSAFIDSMHQTRFAWYIYESGYTVPIARRGFNSYCIKVNKHLSDNHPDNDSQSRYEAVNFENTHTIEVRVFKGTLKLETIYNTLLFLDAVFHWTETVRLPILSSITRDKEFLKFITNKPKYTKLHYLLTHSIHS